MEQYQNQQETTILQAIAISSAQINVPSHDREAAFQILQDFKVFSGRIAICLNWLQSDNPIYISVQNGQQVPCDVTVATKLLALEIIQLFLQNGYSQASDNDRLTLRLGVLRSCRLLSIQATRQQQQMSSSRGSGDNDGRDGIVGTGILARKLAVLLEGLVVRDFPQRWATLAQDLFTPIQYDLATTNGGNNNGGLWEELYIVENGADQKLSHVGMIGVQICLECFRLIAEDCTDSDFNSKISTTRRNDILLGLNEIAESTFLPLFFKLLEQCVAALTSAKVAVHNMNLYLLSQNRTIYQMNQDESAQYRIEERTVTNTSRLLFDTLRTLEIFCANLPSSWILGGSSNTQNNTNTTTTGQSGKLDFVAALLHLMRIPDSNVQVKAIECLEQLSIRGKLELNDWMRLITDIPNAFQEANQILTTTEQEYRKTMARVKNEDTSDDNNNNTSKELAAQLDFHRALSRALATIVSSHMSIITADKNIVNGQGGSYMKLHNFLSLLVTMLRHPSGRILSEQIVMWTTLFRDPQISKSHAVLRPFTEELLNCCMDHLIKVRWEDIENEVHINYPVLEASFDDEDDYEEWMNDLRSRSSSLFKFIGANEPAIASNVLNNRLQSLLAKHGNGEPYDHLNTTNQQLTQNSEAIIQLEAFCQPLDNTLCGIPSWAIEGFSNDNNKRTNKHSPPDHNDRLRAEIHSATSASLSAIAAALVQWKPNYVWLKFRHVTLLESIKHFWEHDPTTLLQGIDTMIRYLGLPDEWKTTGQLNSGIITDSEDQVTRMSGEMISLKKRSGTALVSVSKRVPNQLVPWLSQLSEATKGLLSSDAGLIPLNQMHLYEFLSCVATAVTNPQDRSQFIADVLSDAVTTLESTEIKDAFSSSTSLFTALGVLQAASDPGSVTDPTNVRRVSSFYHRMFTALNRLLSVGRRCNEAARKRAVLGGISIDSLPSNSCDFGGPGQLASPPDEGPLSISDLAISDPFTPLWPRILPAILQIYEVTLSAWRPENMAALMQNPIQRYVFAISDDEAYMSKNQNTKAAGGVFGEKGTAGSVVAGTDRRDLNLVPKWSGWFNELRNSCFQMLGLLITQRALFAPEIAPMYPRIVSVLIDPINLKSMEHRHLTQFLKHVVEFLLLCCPVSLYNTHLEPIAAPIFEHMRYRLEKTWSPVLNTTGTASDSNFSALKALTSTECNKVAMITSRGEDEWFSWYYSHAGLFVGDLDTVTAEAAVEKYRVEISRTFSDVLQAALALKGEWALVLANYAKEEQALKRNDPSKLTSVPGAQLNTEGIVVNADGSPKLPHQAAIDARKMLRITCLAQFLLLGSERIAGNITLTVIQCLGYPDAYTCRRVTKICHSILECAAWVSKYTQLLGQQMFTQAIKNLVLEPKWMVGIEWDMISVIRDIYCRLVLGQMLLRGGQGPGIPLNTIGDAKDRFEQSKTVNQLLLGGGILEVPSSLPREILASLPGIGPDTVIQFEEQMKAKRAAKDQKDFIRDLLRIASDKIGETNSSSAANVSSIFDRAVEEESLLHSFRRPAQIQDLPEKLITRTQVKKAAAAASASSTFHDDQPNGLVNFSL